MTEGERTYVRKLVRNLLSRGLYLDVHDGEEWVLRDGRQLERVMDALGHTDMDEIVARDAPRGKRMGWFMLVYGNDPDGSEVIADCTANDLCDKVCNEVYGIA